MKKTAFFFLVFLVVVSGSGASAWGSLVSQDFLAPGDGLITFDSETGLEWLDLSATSAHSYLELKGGYGEFLTTHGFHYADGNDLYTLYQHAGVVIFGVPGNYSANAATYYALNGAGVKNLLNLMSATFSIPPSTFQEAVGMYVLYDPAGNSSALKAGSVHLNEGALESWVTISDTPYAPGQDTKSFLYGSYLVRDALPVPLPSAFVFLGAGLAALLGLKRGLQKT
ncbi:MAG: hypothetical protein HY885_00025 [Deltaproteobacteria bacterium]|nr:hypothetical protein [Deltaproteobacteria bacterium]